MTIETIIAAAIAYGPRYVGGMVGVNRDIAAMADLAGANTGAFLADLEERFPEEFEAAIG